MTRIRTKHRCPQCRMPIFIGQSLSSAQGVKDYTHAVCPPHEDDCPRCRGDGWYGTPGIQCDCAEAFDIEEANTR